ncbi:MAG: acyl-CoA desaturase [Proteobacteria bacterium]|nr:acyl-CoA desaturase [Pseudomonadota bacterium]
MTTARHDMFDEPYMPTNVFIALFVTALAVIGVPAYVYYNGVTGYEVAAYIFYHMVPGYAITAGYHRMFSHQAYKAHWSVRLAYAIFGAAAVQNSILAWSRHHRVHHKFVDDPVKDPYPITRGFLHAHIGWVLKKQNHNPEMDHVNLRDLYKDPIVMWQHKYYWYIVFVMNVIIPVGLGLLVGRPLGMFMFATVLRLFVVENIMFSTNSLCHMWGKRPYTDANSATDSHLMGLFLLGEGYHNFHHRFEYDYRNGHHWYDLDSTKWLIAGLAKLGLVTDLRRATTLQINNAVTSMAMKRADKKLSRYENWATVQTQLEELRAKMLEKISHWEDMKEQMQAMLAEKREETSAKLDDMKAKLEDAQAQWMEAREQFRQQLRMAFSQVPAAA